MNPSRGEIWFVRRDLYLADYMGAFRALGFSVRMVDREEAERAGTDGHPRPALVIDTNLGAPTFRIVNARGIPFVGLLLDQWYFSPGQDLTLQQIRIAERMNLTPTMTFMDWNLAPGSPAFRKDAPDLALSRLFLFPCGPEQVAPLARRGVAHAEQMHFGVDTDRFRPLALTDADHRRFGAPVSFVGSPLVAAGRDARAGLVRSIETTRKQVPASQAVLCDRLRALLDELTEIQSRDLFRYRLPDLLPGLEDRHGVRFFLPPDMTAGRETLLIRFGVHFSMLQRVEAVRRLVPHGIAVHGSREWEGAGIPGLDYRGEADWATDLPKVINASGININVSKIMFETGVGPRLFETLACGGFLLSNRNAGIAELFTDGKDLVFYESLDDLEDKVRYYLEHPGERRDIGEHGRRTVLARHTLLHRARRIVSVLEEAGVIPSALESKR